MNVFTRQILALHLKSPQHRPTTIDERLTLEQPLGKGEITERGAGLLGSIDAEYNPDTAGLTAVNCREKSF